MRGLPHTENAVHQMVTSTREVHKDRTGPTRPDQAPDAQLAPLEVLLVFPFFAVNSTVASACWTTHHGKTRYPHLGLIVLPCVLSELWCGVIFLRNNRAQESWVRSASTTLTRFRLAALACAEALQAGVEASRLLAHQVPHTRDGILRKAQIPQCVACCSGLGTVVIVFCMVKEFP